MWSNVVISVGLEHKKRVVPLNVVWDGCRAKRCLCGVGESGVCLSAPAHVSSHARLVLVRAPGYRLLWLMCCGFSRDVHQSQRACARQQSQ